MTTGTLDDDALRDQAGLYVLGALTDAERATFEAHLATCAGCAGEVRSLSPIAGALGQAVVQVDPPAALRDRVMRAVGAPATNRSVVALPVQRRTAPIAAWLAAATSLAVAIGFGAYATQLRREVGALELRLRDAMARADASEREVADARRTAGAAESRLAVLTAPDLARIDLTGQPAAPSASARAFWSRSRGLVFTAANLPALPAGRVYQLWVLSAQPAPIGAGLLRPDADGRVNVVIDTPPDLPRPTAMAVTIEPEGGMPAPTGDKYLVGLAAGP